MTEAISSRPFIGTAGWAIGSAEAGNFPAEGSTLERYAQRFNAVEINSSFYRPHRPATWERWRDSVPTDFRFAVKLPKAVTHERKLRDCDEELERFGAQIKLLRDRLAVVLVQLPPSLEYDGAVAAHFFERAAARLPAPMAIEPRNPSWFEAPADELLRRVKIARVAADPARVDAAARPGPWGSLAYWRLHGSPRIYRSSYIDRIDDYAALIRQEVAAGRACWCIFDNTASSAAIGDALALQGALD